MKKTIKSHLLIQDKFLGALLYFKDVDGRGCLKLSFKNKIMGFVKGTDIPTTLPVPLKLDEPISLDLSYKFPDSLLEVKKIVAKKVQPEFYDVTLPISNCLFFIRLKDWRSLDDAKPSKSPLVLMPPDQSDNVVIVFSFLGANGLPFVPAGYVCPMGMGIIALPEDPLKTFCIGIADDSNNTDTNGFNVYIPLPVK
jgi:hypothetical protein